MTDDVSPDPPPDRPSAAAYAGAAAAVAAATLARAALDPVLGNNYPTTTFFVAAALVAGFGRTRTAVLALLAGALLATFLFVPPRYTLAPADPNAVLGIGLYLLVGSVVVLMSHAMRAARRRTERALAAAVAREGEVRRVQEELRAADRRKDEFLATLAHELRNPLAPIRTGLRLLGMAGVNPADTEKTRTIMERQLTQLVRLVDDLMDVSRISRGRIELRREPVLLAAVVDSAVEASRPLIDQMGHRLTVSLPAEPVTLDADLTRLAQVVQNLLNNAAKYSDRGSAIALTAARDGGDVLVSVRDSGIGIPPDKLAAVFEMFAQVDHAVGKSQGGLGIGLSLVKRLVEMHGGTIEARSAGRSCGSEFVVRLPATAAAPAAPVAPDDPAPRSGLRVLVVDDNSDGADSLAEVLRRAGNEVVTAYDGEAALAAAAAFRPAVVVTDVGMPKMDGLELARRIRAEPWGGAVTLIALTGWGLDDDVRRAREAGIDRHVVKPVDPAALLNLLAELGAVEVG